MEYYKRYQQWLNDPYYDEDTKKELEGFEDRNEIEERFCTLLEFGTGGLRGVMGAGINRMNRYTVRLATKGVADWLGEGKAVAIAYDTRENSEMYAKEVSTVLAENGILAYMFQEPMPTPVLSFAVRYLQCEAGIVITASHNPKEYNGYKVYNSEGGQLVPEEAEVLEKYIRFIEDITSICPGTFEDLLRDGRIVHITDEVLDAFTDAVLRQSLGVSEKAKKELSVIYTPIHGAGRRPVMMALQRDGFIRCELFQPQAEPDGNFSTVTSPNPEESEALAYAIAYANKKRADVVIGTDPDCDRLGVAVMHDGQYRLLTGNQTGAILVDAVLENKMRIGVLPANSVILKTIVTSELGARIAESRGLMVINTLTGFKYIGQKISELEKTKAYQFLLGYEESYGYLVGDHARDKDAVVAAMLVSEVAAEYKSRGRTLVDALEALYNEYGYFYDFIDTFTYEGIAGRERMQGIMGAIRKNGRDILDEEVVLEDYLEGIQGLPAANVLRLRLCDGSWAAIRPSGTEPKLKIYYSVRGKCEEETKARFKDIQKRLKEYFQE